MSGLKKLHFQLAQQENLLVLDYQLDCAFFQALCSEQDDLQIRDYPGGEGGRYLI